MKKMAIVPYQMLEDMQRYKRDRSERPRLPPNPYVTNTAQNQRELSSVLERSDLSESEKEQKYGETLQKFQMSHKKALQPSLVIPDSNNRNDSLHERIIESVPLSMKRKAKSLLSVLESHPRMSWDEHGVLSYDDSPIEGSNIIDLVNDAIRHRKGFNPTGWETFTRGLKDVNIPQDFVGNHERWLWMHRQHPPRKYKTHPPSPFPESATPKTRGAGKKKESPTPKASVKRSSSVKQLKKWEAL